MAVIALVLFSRRLLPKISTLSLARMKMPVPVGTAATMLPAGAKFGVLLRNDLVVVDARARAVDRQAGQVEDQDAAGVHRRGVAVDVGAGRVLDLDAGDVELDGVVADDDVARLADVDAGVGGAADDRLLDEDVLALHRIEAVGAVVGVGAVGPLGTDAAEGDAVGADRLERCRSSACPRGRCPRAVKSSPCTSRPSPPPVRPAKLRTVASMPSPRRVTWSTVNESGVVMV